MKPDGDQNPRTSGRGVVNHYKKRAVIAFDVDAEQVSIIGVFYGGQDYETILQDDSEDGAAHGVS